MNTSSSILPKAANRFPISIRKGDVEAKIYRTPTRIRGSQYDTYTLCWQLNGRQRRRFSDLAEAKREGERIGREKALGTLAVSAISAVDRITLQGVLGELAEGRDYGSAVNQLRVGGVRLLPAVSPALGAGVWLGTNRRANLDGP